MERRGLLVGQRLSPRQWAFVTFHTAKDLEDERAKERAQRRELYGMFLLAMHDPKAARTILLDEERQAETGADDGGGRPRAIDGDQDEWTFLALDPLFCDRTRLSEHIERETGGDPLKGWGTLPVLPVP